MPEDLQKWKRMQSDSMTTLTSNIEALHMPIYTTSLTLISVSSEPVKTESCQSAMDWTALSCR